jgi:hypothetical protein
MKARTPVQAKQAQAQKNSGQGGSNFYFQKASDAGVGLNDNRFH